MPDRLMTVEIPKRLTPKGDTLRELFLKSGNLCAFPECHRLMMDADGSFIGLVCHIEAAEPGGERFNAAMTNEERRAVTNLLLLCHEHHVKTDDTTLFDVARMKQMKSDHEKRFADPDRAMLATLSDWTELDTPALPTNLARLARVLGWDLGPEELAEPLEELGEYVERFRAAPIETRRFVGEVAKRALKLRGKPAMKARWGDVMVALEDIQDALRLPDDTLRRLILSMGNHSLGYLDEIDSGDFGFQRAVRISRFGEGLGWLDLVDFCRLEHIDPRVLYDDLQFSRLGD